MLRLFISFTTIIVLSSGILTACASVKSFSLLGNSTNAPKPVVKSQQAPASEASKIERVPFELGISSVTVERMAKKSNCQSTKGAGLLHKKGPVEVYRVLCEDGREIKARCEMRQCEVFNP
ncbi:hypothetical protein [Undibacterium sp.]|uniref:hypothetical protein n=1 Tax=Undibacterium sp. TaxID=1914977 RepID=UPI003750B764